RTSPLSVTHPVLSHPPAALSFVLFSPSTTPTEIYTLSLHDALPISCYLLLNILFLSMVSIIFHALSYYNPFLFYFFYKLYHNKQANSSSLLVIFLTLFSSLSSNYSSNHLYIFHKFRFSLTLFFSFIIFLFFPKITRQLE